MANYSMLSKQLTALLATENNFIANSSQLSGFIFNEISNINWAGFYFLEQNELVLGPYQGKVACVRIPMGKGVCGTAAQSRQVTRVANVHEFDGHIACDSASRSEIVIPLVHQGQLFGVFDIDSPQFDRFDEDDEIGLTRLIDIYLNNTQFL